MTDTDPRLEAATGALLSVWQKNGEAGPDSAALHIARDTMTIVDALRAFDQASNADPKCPNCRGITEHLAWCPYGPRQPESEVMPHRPGDESPVEHNATAPVMEADLPWLGAAIETFLACRPEGSDLERLGQRIMAVLAFANAQPPAAAGILAGPRSAWPDPTPEMQASSLFEAIWSVIKTWDIAVPEAYGGYCSATGNHVRAILDAINAQPPSEAEIDVAHRAYLENDSQPS